MCVRARERTRENGRERGNRERGRGRRGGRAREIWRERQKVRGKGGGKMERERNVELIFPHASAEWESICSIEIGLIAILSDLFAGTASRDVRSGANILYRRTHTMGLARRT